MASSTKKTETGGQRLLEQGARTYLNAASAVIAFQHEVQKRCRTVVEANLKDHAAALGLRLTTDEIEEVAWPSSERWSGEYWCLGVQIKRKDIPDIRWWETYCCLQFDAGDEQPFCWIGQWFPNRKFATEVGQKLRNLSSTVQVDGKEIWLQTEVAFDNIGDFDRVLDELTAQWIDLWSTLGGLKKVFDKG